MIPRGIRRIRTAVPAWLHAAGNVPALNTTFSWNVLNPNPPFLTELELQRNEVKMDMEW